MDRRSFLAGVLAAPLLVRAAAAAGTGRMTVSRSPNCGCCGAWAGYMREAGFEVEVREVPDAELAALKQRLGLAPDQTSCHTAEVDGYVVEGHVPAEDVRRLLAERPDALGLSVPGMPAGSPGMDTGGAPEPFDTILIRRDGSAEVFASH